IFLWVAAGILVLTLALHFGYFPRFGESPSLERPFVAEGRVVRKVLLRDKDGRAVTRITYRFQTSQGLSVEGRASQRGGKWADLQAGDTVWVLYSGSDPRRNRLAARGGPSAGGEPGRSRRKGAPDAE
ncbi:MAG: DUF3592 domain-containing protein, partial [Nitrospinota bacterium]